MCVSVTESLFASRFWVALTMTVWAVSQSDVVKNSNVVFRLTSVPKCPVIATVTVAVGREASATM